MAPREQGQGSERVLTKSKTDPDFASARMIDEGRVALGLPPLADTPLDALLLEAGGRWKGVDEGMMEGFLEYTFLPKGKLEARSHDGESGRWFEQAMTWKVVGDAVVLSARKTKQTWRLQECGEMSGNEGMCLVIDGGGQWLAR